jgi:hypothetical protein
VAELILIPASHSSAFDGRYRGRILIAARMALDGIWRDWRGCGGGELACDETGRNGELGAWFSERH